jgi:hypothetical protein
MSLILLVFAFVLACVAAGIPTVGRWQLIAIALACFFLAEILGSASLAHISFH